MSVCGVKAAAFKEGKIFDARWILSSRQVSFLGLGGNAHRLSQPDDIGAFRKPLALGSADNLVPLRLEAGSGLSLPALQDTSWLGAL